MTLVRTLRRDARAAARLAAATLVIALAPCAAVPPAAAAPRADPIPAAALEHPPTALLAAVPPLAGLAGAKDCDLLDLRRSIDRESDAARARLEADYGTADAPPAAAMPAQKRVLDRAAGLEGDCLDALDMDATMRRTVEPEIEALRADLRQVGEEFRTAFAACPSGPEGGKNAACTRSLYARANVRGLGAVHQHLKVADAEFAEGVRRATACLGRRETLVKDGIAAGIAGAAVRTVLAPLTRAWAVPPLVAEKYTSICRNVQEAESDIPKPR